MENGMEEMQKLVAEYVDERTKFNAGNKSAGTRARKALQGIKTLAQDERKAIQEQKNA
jgi:hypothetical protein